MDVENVDIEREGTKMRYGEEQPHNGGLDDDDIKRSQSHGIVL